MDEVTESTVPPYRGRLSPQSASAGISAAKTNARRLLTDAETLLRMERHPSACALAALAIEESSKPAIIRKVLLARTPEEHRKGWRLFSSHHDKAAPWVVPHIVRSRPGTFENFVEAYMRQGDPVLLDSLKQLSIYCGCYGNCHWANPSDVIERDQSELVVDTARFILLSLQLSNLDSPAGLALWQSHMEGCFSVGYVTANNKVVEFFHAAADAGLLAERRIPPDVAFDFMTTVLVLSDGEAAEQARWLGLDAGNLGI